MSFNVRVFAYAGVQQIPVNKPTQYSADSIYTLDEPYIFAQTLSISGSAVSSSADTDSRTRILRIEVPDGQQIRYEINPPGRSVAAGSQSPSMSGKDQFFFRNGWTVSIVDASGLP